MSETVVGLQKRALNIRRDIITMLAAAGSGHPGGSLGVADVMAALYFDIMKWNPKNPHDKKRDLLVLSNGHIVPAQYAALAEAGAIKKHELMSLRQLGSRLQGHPERSVMSWMEVTSGPLGSGLSEAAGMAWAILYRDQKNFSPTSFVPSKPAVSAGFFSEPGQAQNTEKNSGKPMPSNEAAAKTFPDRFVYCIVGDGELDEGNIWEGAMFASKYALENLITFVMRNQIQLDGDTEEVMPLEPLKEKWESFGWQVLEVDGHNIESVISACELARAETDKPTAIIAHTILGKGVSFMENNSEWHGKTITPADEKRALEELK